MHIAKKRSSSFFKEEPKIVYFENPARKKLDSPYIDSKKRSNAATSLWLNAFSPNTLNSKPWYSDETSETTRGQRECYKIIRRLACPYLSRSVDQEVFSAYNVQGKMPIRWKTKRKSDLAYFYMIHSVRVANDLEMNGFMPTVSTSGCSCKARRSIMGILFILYNKYIHLK